MRSIGASRLKAEGSKGGLGSWEAIKLEDQNYPQITQITQIFKLKAQSSTNALHWSSRLIAVSSKGGLGSWEAIKLEDQNYPQITQISYKK